MVLHTLRCTGAAGLTRLAQASGLDESDVESELIDLAVAGFVTRVPGGFGAWSLTDAGRAEDTRIVAEEVSDAEVHAVVSGAFDDFLVLNPEALDLCTAWQMRSVDGVVTVNDHRDTAYDTRVLSRFADLHDRALAVITALGAALPRFDRYRVRLTEALTRARAGEVAYVTDDFGAYHTVWFELHEDLLVTLGKPRHG